MELQRSIIAEAKPFPRNMHHDYCAGRRTHAANFDGLILLERHDYPDVAALPLGAGIAGLVSCASVFAGFCCPIWSDTHDWRIRRQLLYLNDRLCKSFPQSRQQEITAIRAVSQRSAENRSNIGLADWKNLAISSPPFVRTYLKRRAGDGNRLVLPDRLPESCRLRANWTLNL